MALRIPFDSFPHPLPSFPHTPTRHSHTYSRHSRTQPRHSPTQPRHIPHPPTSFPRRRESKHPCIALDRTEPTYYHRTMTTQRNHVPGRHLAIRNPQSAMPQLAVDRNRHNATESDEPQRKLVLARASYRTCRTLIPNRAAVSCPRARATAPSHVIPAKAGIPSPGTGCAPSSQRIRRTAWSCRPLAGHANKSNGTALSVGGDSWHTIS